MFSESAKRIAWNIAALTLSCAVLLTLSGKAVRENSSAAADKEAVAGQSYESRLFDSSYVHTVDIRMDAGDYANMLETAIEKNKYRADVTIDGELFSGIAVSTKGSASLKAIAGNAESNRYSLKLIFDKYDDSLTYYGLEAIHLNNNVSDASYMRDFISYSMFREMDFPAPLTAYTTVTVNGEPYGFFLAVENIGEGFLARTLDSDGELYKPESTAGPGGGDICGSDLTYLGNLTLSYSDIFDNAVTECSGKDQKAVVKALQNLSEGNISAGVNTAMVCRYFAVHNFTLNSDSYLSTGSIIHNYYLYENDGLLAMLPWDYNNAYALSNSIQMDFLIKNIRKDGSGSFPVKSGDSSSGSSDATASGGTGTSDHGLIQEETHPASYFINKGIDTPLMGESNSRPMWSFIPENQVYLEQYHSCMNQLITQYFESGFFEKEFCRVYSMINPYIEADASRMYTMDEVEAETERLKTICTLRAQSIRRQLDGGLSCDSATQNEADWIDASVLDK